MTKIISFPHLGDYYIPIKYIIQNITKCQIYIPSLNNKKTIITGSKYSPNDICMPFKYNLGNYIEALDNGANILIQAGGGCRYGYFAELQEEILKNLGYKFEFINLIKNNHISIKKLYNQCKIINKKLNIFSFIKHLTKGILMIIYMDKIYRIKREGYVISADKEKINTIIRKLKATYSNDKISTIKIIKTYLKLKKDILSIPKNKVEPIKILLIGELFTLMDKNANNELENNLIKGSIIYRYTDLTYLLLKKKFYKNILLRKSKEYLKYHLGADGTESIAHTIEHVKKGIDGIIHIKSYGCVPEINAIPILNKISEDYNTPILYLSYDGENNISNIDTKIEAFYDMIKSKKRKF